MGVPDMSKKSPRPGSFQEYMAEVLKNAVYEKGEQLDVIVAEAPDFPGCMTQGATFEEARENLVDAIEVWLMSELRSGEDPPVVNGCRLKRLGFSERKTQAGINFFVLPAPWMAGGHGRGAEPTWAPDNRARPQYRR
jgi:predicted RNase H-like HicB family nuclease